MKIFYSNRDRFPDHDYHEVSLEEMAKFVQEDSDKVETPYFNFVEAVCLDKVEDGNLYFSQQTYN